MFAQPPVPSVQGATAALPRGMASYRARVVLRSNGNQEAASNLLRTKTEDLTDATLKTARQFADAGLLKEATEVCERHLREYGASANAYYLLGLVLDAQSSPRALDCYRKALYLQPNHYETLLQMAVLSQRDGDAARADRFKRRARQSIESGLSNQRAPGPLRTI